MRGVVVLPVFVKDIIINLSSLTYMPGIYMYYGSR